MDVKQKIDYVRMRGVENIETPALELFVKGVNGEADPVISQAIFELERRYDLEKDEEGNVSEEEFLKIVPFNYFPEYKDEEDWLLEDVFCKGGLFTFSAYNKTGKTVFLTCMYRGMQEGTFIGKKVTKMKVLHISEEYEKQWSKKRSEFGQIDVDIAPHTLKKSTTMEEWEASINRLLVVCKENEYDVVVFDTLDSFWCAKDESDSNMGDIVEVLKRLTQEGICVIAVMHTGKGDYKDPAKALRGHSSLNDRADGIVVFTRMEANILNNKRKLTTLAGRFVNESHEVIVEFDNDKKDYIKIAENTYEMKLESEKEKIMEFLSINKDEAECVSGLQRKIRELDESAPKSAKMKICLNSLVKDKKVERYRKGKTFYYWKIVNEWKEVE